uniref:Uncharacterized protein n=1 Tax=Panagrolaimus davidi TaxID=227884 RepID=A0A914R881_9BILA
MSRFFEFVVNRKKKMAFVNGSERVINVTIIDLAGTHSVDQNLSFITVNAKEFVRNIPITFSNCKSVILSIFDVYSPDYPNNMEFCKAIQAQMKKHDIRHQFISSEYYFFSTALIATKVCFQSPCLFILIKDDKIIISGSHLKLSQAGHQLIGYKQIPLDENITSEKFIAAILPFRNTYRNIIAIAEKPKTSAISVLKKTDFKAKKLHVIENINQHKNYFAIELSKWQMFDFYNQYFFLPICTRQFVITGHNDNEIISTNIGDSLPLKKSCNVSNFPSKYFSREK